MSEPLKLNRSEWEFVPHPPPHDRTEWVRVVCRIRNNATGEIRERQEECVWDETEDGWTGKMIGPSTFWWSDGNMACDCNRSTLFHGAEDHDDSCSDNRYSLELLNPKTGVVFYTEFTP
jgi:hypothetical protein